MKQKFFKIIAIFVLTIFVWQEIFSIGSTWSFFSDIEVSQDNTFQAGTLDLEATSPTDNFVNNYEGDDGSSASGYAASREVEVFDAGAMFFDYSVKVGNVNGDEEFCNDLDVMANLEGSNEYTGKLVDLSTSNIEFNGASDKWLFVVYSENNELLNVNCSFSLVFEANQRNEDVFSGREGFKDEEILGNSINSGGVILNEFLPDPSGSEAHGEWVELYNTSDHDIDVEGWVLYDDNDNHGLVIRECYTNLDTTLISPHGFLVVYRKTGRKCSSEFNLNNGGDEVRLYTDRIENGGVLIDRYVYGNESDNEEEESDEDNEYKENNEDNDNDDDNESENDDHSKINISYGRFPDGTGSWFDLLPTPGMLNVLASENDKNDHDDDDSEEDEQDEDNDIDDNGRNGDEDEKDKGDKNNKYEDSQSEEDQDEENEDEKNNQDKKGQNEIEGSYSVGYLNGKTEVIIDNTTGGIIEVSEEDSSNEEKEEISSEDVDGEDQKPKRN